MHRPVLGIIGGVGPLATAYFMELLIRKTPAHSDQEQMPMIVFNDPQIPDRTAYILDEAADDPKPELVKVARWLEEAGADYLAIPCNTAHYYFDAIKEAVGVPVMNIMDETAHRLSEVTCAGATIGLLATEGTVRSGVFQDYLAMWGLGVCTPGEADQQVVNHLIYDCVKANQPYDEASFLEVAERLRARGCAAVIVGCTELSVIYQELARQPEWLVDSLDVLADRCCAYYQQKRAQVCPPER